MKKLIWVNVTLCWPTFTFVVDKSTHRQGYPYMQLCVFLLQDTDDLISFWQLVKVKLDNLQDKMH